MLASLGGEEKEEEVNTWKVKSSDTFQVNPAN